MNYVRASYIGVLAVLAIVLLWSEEGAFAGPLDETRYCGVENIKRDGKGQIIRRADVIRAFRKLYPCDATGKTTGACPGWAINHTLPISQGGCDSVSNLDWMPTAIKSCAGKYCRDRWERRVYKPASPINRQPSQIVDMPERGRIESKW